MAQDRPESGVEDLAFYIANSKATEPDFEQLKSDMRQWLKLGNTSIDPISLILRVFTLDKFSDPERALRNLVDGRRAMARLANEIDESEDDSYCDLSAELGTAIRKVLEVLNFPTVNWPGGYKGLVDLKAGLDEAWINIEQLTAVDYEKFDRYALLAWKQLEKLLKISLNFYGEALGTDESSPVTQAFDSARNKTGLSALLNGVREVQNVYEPDDKVQYEARQADREECQWYFGCDNPFGTFLGSRYEVDSTREPHGWLAKLVELDQSVEKKLIASTSDSVDTDILNWCMANVRYYRNPIAHKEMDLDVETVRNSFERAKVIIDELTPFCPEMILAIETGGTDFYGRRIIRFVGEYNFGEIGSYLPFNASNKTSYLYLDPNTEVKPRGFYFCRRPAHSGMFEPILVPAERVLEGLDHE